MSCYYSHLTGYYRVRFLSGTAREEVPAARPPELRTGGAGDAVSVWSTRPPHPSSGSPGNNST